MRIRSIPPFRLVRRPLAVRALAAVAVALCVARIAGAQQLVFTPYHADGIYDTGERVGWTVAAAPGQAPIGGRFTFIAKRDGLTAVDSGQFELSGGRAVIETRLVVPGMLLVEVRPPAGVSGFRGESRGEVGRALLGAAVAPSRIAPSAPRPDDFDEFWDAKVRALHAIPVDPVLAPHESGRPGVDYYTLRMQNVGGAHVYGQLAKPSGEGKHPALLILQWASPPYPLQRAWVTDRAAEGWLVLNVEPHDVPPDMPQAFYDALPQSIRNYARLGVRDRDDSYFLPMYLADVRAADYLTSRPDWDGRTFVVTGMSMGGQQSFAVAALHPKVTGVVVVVPAGCDVAGPLHGRAAPYPNWDVSRLEVLRTASYFDGANFASRITAPMLVSMGFIDETSTPAGVWAAYNRLRGPKEIVAVIDAPHNHMANADQGRRLQRRAGEWLDAVVHGRDPLAATPRR